VLERLAETRSIWSAGDVEQEVRSTLGVRSGHDALVNAARTLGEEAAIDARAVARAREEWLRDVGRDLRAGVVSRALDVLREKARCASM